ncbi:cupin domain-containing protein [Cupriavidus necator]|uniref:cupin domain-containing protein n=1 Tax=Cupriavidus necator TaxID=106590 RepID=UPI00068EA2FF|nr:cupin domain-containing protein [Cupriavidus necator]
MNASTDTRNFNIADRNESKRFPDGSLLVRAGTLPWTPWAMDGTYFKLLSIDRAIGMFTALLKIDPNTQTPDHHHFGNAHAYVLEGDFSYEYGTIYKGDYIVEAGGINHEPTIGAEGCLLFVVFFAGISGVGEGGMPAGEFVDCEWMYRAAAANGAAAHLLPPPVQERKAQ